MFERFFAGGKKEQIVIEKMKHHIRTFCDAAACFRNAIERHDRAQLYCIADLEREADSTRREILATIYEGAFLPYLRSNLCRFVEIVDEAFDLLKDTASEFEGMPYPLEPDVEEECVKVADKNFQMAELLLLAFEALSGKDDLREKTLAIRIFEKQIDEIKYDLAKKLRGKDVRTFWHGKTISDFVSFLTGISDVIEDASDYLLIIQVSLK